MTSPIDPKEVAATNPAVDLRKLEQVQEIHRVLEAAGVLKKADYRISPPVGTEPRKPPASEGAVRMTREF